MEPLLRVEQLTKRFPQVVANEGVSLEIYKGEIHCLLGENGAGKSTLAECLYGFYKPDSGQIYFKGKPVKLTSPVDAIHLGIGMVHQHFVLAEPMNAVENIIVAEESTGALLNLQAEKQRIQALCDQYGISLDLDTPVGQLSVGQQQWIEILKALYVGVDLLLLDEPTAVLTPQEVETLFSIISKMTERGISILLITHKLNEVMHISQQVTVLRKGKVIATISTADATRSSLAKLLVGREFDFVVHKEHIQPGPPALEIKGLTVLRDNRSQALHDLSLTVHEGEVLGLAGVSGNGQPELFDVLVGVREPVSGDILLNDQSIITLSPAEIYKEMASVPQDRLKQGLVSEFSIQENLILGAHGNPPFCSKFSVLNTKAIQSFAEEAIKRFDIATMGPDQKVHQLSGGNLQKVILARELSHPIKVIVASSPTRGLDIGATYYVYQRFLELLKTGTGILLISEDLDEIFNLSDRIAVIYNGRIMGTFEAGEVNEEKVGLLMAGIEEDK